MSLEGPQCGVVDLRRQDPRCFGRDPVTELASVGVGASDKLPHPRTGR